MACMNRAISTSRFGSTAPIRILHIALQGCVRAHGVEYGVTPDTGGHIRYLLDLVATLDRRPEVVAQTVVVRRFEHPDLSPEYGEPVATLSSKSTLVRIDGRTTEYLPKEALHTELPVLRDRLIAYLDSLPRLPDLVHAHYADAGWLACELKHRIGIPFFFTGHSLGRAKPGPDTSGTLGIRVRHEARAICHAALVIASSRDEAESQYGLYPESRRTRVEVIPPGCDLDAFHPPAAEPATGARSSERSTTRFVHDERFVDRGRPLVLALARPVARKNLVGLIEAFGRHPTLRRRANLAIYTGCEPATGTGSESRSVLDAIAAAVERYRLEGIAAAPVMHRAGEVPALYRAAATSGGVFVNAAFDEPFGLTLLEAAASGLPVVATRHGGPVDIVSTCRNGKLVDPHDPIAIGEAVVSLLEDPAARATAAANGIARLERFSWERHATRYLAEVSAVLRPPRARARPVHLPIEPPSAIVGPWR